ncbi:MAG TPA: nitrilase-related carbon-nitrogen hydrolase [Anaerolineales bacterium]|nr:nitrilase-related carbon-nitrogen hydrolase [Anaerolineales bacterium]
MEAKKHREGMPQLNRYAVAAIQYEPKLFHREKNVADLLELSEEAARNGAKIIVMPEMATTGICFYDREEAASSVEEIPGPTAEAFGQLAKRYGCYIAYGEAEVDPATGAYYNSSVFVGPEGLVGSYRKTHLFLSEPKWAKAGDLGIPVWDTEYGRIGMIICHDAAFPETSRVAALQGADVMCFPTNWLERSPSGYWFTRAFDNGIYWIAANRYGKERNTQFSGNSCIISPNGTLLSCLDMGNGIVYADVDLAQAREKGFPGEGVLSKFTQRRPDVYKAITLDTYLWNPNLFHGLYGHRPLPAGRQSKLAVVQMVPVAGEVAANLKRIEALLGLEPAKNADLVIFPELTTTGLAGEDLASLAEPLPGPTVTGMAVLCRENNQCIVLGIAEREGDQVYNTAALIGPEGLIGKHRQLHLDSRTATWAKPGLTPPRTFDLPLGRVGLLVGHDINFPESTRLLALDGADVICVPAALTFPQPTGVDSTAIPYPKGVNVENDPLHWILWRQRATDDSTYIAVANYYGFHRGHQFLGLSGIFTPSDIYGPRVEAVAFAEEEAVVTLEIDTTSKDQVWPSAPVRAKEFLGLRQPEWYTLCQIEGPPVLERKPGR